MPYHRVTSPCYVGRRSELAALAEALDDARRASPATVVVAGEAGLGKTRLLKEFLRLQADAVHVVWGGCVALSDGGLPFAPIREGFRKFVAAAGERERADIRSAAAPALLGLLPDLDAESSPEVATALSQLAAFEALLRLLRRLGESRPVVLVVDDLQWADRSTLTLLAYLTQNLGSERVLLCAAYRTDGVAANDPLREWLSDQLRGANVRCITPPPLCPEENEQMLAAILGRAPDRDCATGIFERSGGNPFFAEELLRSATAGDRRLPATIQETLSWRFDGLSRAARDLVRIAAVAQGPFDTALLADVAACDELDLFAPLREALEHHVLVEDDDGRRLLFRHALLREAAYADLVPAERRVLHERFASAATISAAEAAFHWGAAGNDGEALTAAVRAAHAAATEHAWPSAARHYERALELWDRVPDVVERVGTSYQEVMDATARAEEFCGNHHRTSSLLERLIDSLDEGAEPGRIAVLYERLAASLLATGARNDARAALAKGLALSATLRRSRERADVLASAGVMEVLDGNLHAAHSYAAQALEVAAATGARRSEAMALATLGLTHSDAGSFEDADSLLRTAIVAAVRSGDAEALIRAYRTYAAVLTRWGATTRSYEVATEGRARVSALGLENVAGAFFSAQAGQSLIASGRWDEALALMSGATEAAHPSRGAEYLHLNMAVLLSLRGDVDAGRAHLERALAIAREAGSGNIRHEREVEAWLRLASGEAVPALTAASAAVDTAFGDDEHVHAAPLLALWFRIAADVADAARTRRQYGAEADVLERAHELERRAATLPRNPLDPASGVPPPYACAATAALAELGRCRDANDPAAWTAAVDAWTNLGRPYDVAYSLWRRAEAVLARGDTAGARDDLRRAREIANELGAAPLAACVEDLARRARMTLADSVSSRASANAQPLDLTERELEVLRELTAGLSNKDIATKLFISPKTASVHVSSILRKLGVGGRVEAAGIAHRAGLVGARPHEGRAEGPGRRPSR